ncbi:putative polysaccharide biosynthesis protein [Acetobacterium woodii]|uniref:Stage V sporulation protein B n=1 Tax=Acetobacterium woodii (strain ATCC 29683 / DSM 1030 / JCM 2381 / KCTC 1655 / WB1) TaxID=931626 RepID=H6LI24_ACEWD|nr:polysaccharide biosynthesis protein [Acetobacterium woodii]AFA49724.1 stage V sporulation protein B [Acetobacterium woodii DSM 1030]
MSERTSSYLKGASILVGAGILSRLLGVFFKIPLYQMVGSYGNGIYGNVTSIYNLLLMVSTVGFPVAISKMVSENVAKKEYATAHRVFKISIAILVVLGTFSSLFLFFGAEWIIEVANWTAESYPALVAIALAPLFISFVSAYRGFFQGFQIMTPTAISQIIEQLIRVFLGMLLCWVMVGQFGIGLGVGGAVFGATAGGLVAAILLSFLYHEFVTANKRLLKTRTRKRQRSNRELIKRLVIISIPVTLTSALVAMFSTVDSFIYVSRLAVAGIDEITATMMFGDFTNAETLITIPLVISGNLAVAMIPAISESFAKRDRKEMNEKIVLAIRVILLIAFPSCIGLSVLSYGIFNLLFPGSPYGGFILSTYSYATIFMMLSNTFQSILQSIDRFRIPLINLGIAIIIRFITGWIFLSIPFFNIQGIVISSVITFAFLTVANYLSVKRYTHVDVDFFHILIKPLFAAVIMGILVFYAYKGISALLGGFIGIALSLIIGVLVYSFVLILIRGITEKEIRVLPGSRTLLTFYRRLNRLIPGRKRHSSRLRH